MWLRDKYHSLRLSPWLTDLAVALVIFFFTYGLTIYRIEKAPDIFTDEILYTRLGIRTAGEGALVWDSGEAFIVHPPLYFISEAIYFTFTGKAQTTLYAAGNIFSSVFSARHINAFLAGLTAVILYFFGRRLHSDRLGLLLALIFSLDPFILRINRRAMLETMAGMLVLAGMALYFVHSKSNPQPGTSRLHFLLSLTPKPGLIMAGLLFGLALLTKELAFISLIAVAIFSILEFIYNLMTSRRMGEPFRIITNFSRTLYPAVIAISIAGLTYLLYPLWAFSIGEWSNFSQEKILGIKRLLGLVQLTGWNRPGFSLLDFLFQRLADYGSSYLLISLGGIATLCLALWVRHHRPARFLIAWGLTLYPFFAFLAVAGSGNDQFFYFLIVPAIVLVGYAVMVISELKKDRLQFRRMPLFAGHIPILQGDKLAVLLLLVVIMPYGVYRWWTRYAVGLDNGYTQFAQFVQAKLPPQVPLNASGDPIKFHYFFPSRLIFNIVTPEEAIKAGVHFFALTPKDARYRYGKFNPEFATWVKEHGNLVYSVNGDSYGDIFLYYVVFPDQSGKLVQPENSGDRHWRSYQVARSGFVGTFIISLFVWFILWGFLILVVYGLQIVRRSDLPYLQKFPENMKFPPIPFIKSWFT